MRDHTTAAKSTPRLQNERGIAMLGALAILLMIGILGIASVETSTTDMNMAGNYVSEVQAFYIAEAGSERSFAALCGDPSWRDGFNDEQFASGSYSVDVFDSITQPALAETIVVISTGLRSFAQRTIETKAVPASPFIWVLFGDDEVELKGTTYTDSYNSDSGTYAATMVQDDGDIGSNGYISVGGTADVYGDGFTSSPGAMDIYGAAFISGDTTTTAPHIPVDPIAQSDIDDAIANNAAPAGFSGSYTYSAGLHKLTVKPSQSLVLAAGTYYFEMVELKGEVQLAPGAEVKWYVMDDLSVTAQADVNSNGSPKQFLILFSGPELRINGNAELRAAVYAPNAEIDLVGSADLYGSFLARDIDDHGGAQVHYDRALRNLLFGTFRKVSWQELN